MADPPYEPGDTVRLRAVLTDAETGSPIVPSAVSVSTRNPTGVMASYTFAGASTPTAIASGIYQLDVAVDYPGVWNYRWVATGPMTVERGTIPVGSSFFT